MDPIIGTLENRNKAVSMAAVSSEDMNQNIFGFVRAVQQADPRVNPLVNDDFAYLQHITMYGPPDLVQFLLDDPRVDWTEHSPMAIEYASYNNTLDNFYLLLRSPKIIIPRDMIGYFDDVIPLSASILVREGRVDVTLEDLRVACELSSHYNPGAIPFVQAVLEEGRVDPSQSDNECLRESLEKMDMPMIKLLLSDPRVALSGGAFVFAEYMTVKNNDVTFYDVIRNLPPLTFTEDQLFKLRDAAKPRSGLEQYWTQKLQEHQPRVPGGTSQTKRLKNRIK